jgi:hypothetical protein
MSWGPLSDLVLPETVTLTDIDGAPAWLPVSGDGARLATSDLAFASAAQGELSARCSFCPPFEGGVRTGYLPLVLSDAVVHAAALSSHAVTKSLPSLITRPLAFEGPGTSAISLPPHSSTKGQSNLKDCVARGRAAQTDCTDWRRYCDLTAKVSMTVAGTVRAAGDTCVLADPSCADSAGDVSACVFATATSAAANLTRLTMTVSSIHGDHLCSAAGVTEGYLNDVLSRYSPQLEAEVEMEIAAGVVGGLNNALASQHVRPYSAHPSALTSQR